MGKKYRILFTILLGVVLCGIGWWISRPSELVYHGKTFRTWVCELAETSMSDNPIEAKQAINHIGTNGIPCMLEMLATRDSALKRSFRAIARKQTLIPIKIRNPLFIREYGSMMFGLFGTNAAPAVPGLIHLLKDNDPDIRNRALQALRNIGPAASNAVPILIISLKTTDEFYVEEVKRTLKVITPDIATNAGIK